MMPLVWKLLCFVSKCHPQCTYWLPCSHPPALVLPVARVHCQCLVKETPHGIITNLDLVLAGRLLHLDAFTQACDITEYMVLSKGEDLSTMFWDVRVAYHLSDPPPISSRFLLCTLMPINTILDLTTSLPPPTQFLVSVHGIFIWPKLIASIPLLTCKRTPAINSGHHHHRVSAIISTLLRKQFNKDSLLVMPPEPT